jgi:hypothetical protein
VADTGPAGDLAELPVERVFGVGRAVLAAEGEAVLVPVLAGGQALDGLALLAEPEPEPAVARSRKAAMGVSTLISPV